MRKSLQYGRVFHTEDSSVRKGLPYGSLVRTGILPYGRSCGARVCVFSPKKLVSQGLGFLTTKCLNEIPPVIAESPLAVSVQTAMAMDFGELSADALPKVIVFDLDNCIWCDAARQAIKKAKGSSETLNFIFF